jgi:molybdate transport system ATP-binding protein
VSLDVEDAVIEARFEGRLGGFRLHAAFSVSAHGVTAIVGPSGCGKTTLLRCVAGLTRLPGLLRVKGEVWQDAGHFTPPHRRAVGYVFQEPSLLANLPVRANLLFGYRRARDRSKFKPDEVIALLGVEPLLARSTVKLSGGERQRVAIGRALLSQPELLLLDEPVSGLDAESKAEILPYLERLPQALSIPILYVSHDPAEVARLADHILVMRAGEIAASAPAEAGALNQAAAGEAIARLGLDEVRRLAAAALMAGLRPPV